MTFSKGPWTVGNDGYNANTVYAGDTGVCHMYGVPMNTRLDEVPDRYAAGMANARLIAAAPELLEALEAFVSLRDQTSVLRLTSDVMERAAAYEKAFEVARTAISKAKGMPLPSPPSSKEGE